MVSTSEKVFYRPELNQINQKNFLDLDMFVFFCLSLLHSAFLQDDAAETNHSPGHGVCCEYYFHFQK